MKIKIHIVSFVALTFFAWPVFAAPSISGVSGNLTHGSPVTISGSGFGTKTQAAPTKYDSFESGTNGAVVSGWDQNNSNLVSYSTAYTRGASTKVARHNANFANGGSYNMSLGDNDNFYPYVYLDFWMRVDTVGGINNPSRNFKPWRIYGIGGGDPQVDYAIGSDGNSLTNLCDGSCASSWTGDVEKTSWRHYQISILESGSGTANGTFRHLIDSTPCGHNSSTVITRNGSGHYGEVRVGHYWAEDLPTNDGADIYTDDIYIDKTWARVEIGNAATYAASAHREIQIPSAWVASSVTVNVNRGSFASSDSAYLYLTDSTGATNSSGYPITFGGGGGGDATAPGAPGGLMVR